MNIVDKILNKHNIRYDWVLTNVIDESCFSVFILKYDFIKNEEFLNSILRFGKEEQNICGIDFIIIDGEHFDYNKIEKLLNGEI